MRVQAPTPPPPPPLGSSTCVTDWSCKCGFHCMILMGILWWIVQINVSFPIFHNKKEKKIWFMLSKSDNKYLLLAPSSNKHKIIVYLLPNSKSIAKCRVYRLNSLSIWTLQEPIFFIFKECSLRPKILRALDIWDPWHLSILTVPMW